MRCLRRSSGLIVGAPALRVRGMYLMILTLGFGEIVRVFFLNFEPTGGPSGLGGIPPLTATVVGRSRLCGRDLLVPVPHALGAARPRDDRVHEDDVAAEAMGINLLRIKLSRSRSAR